MTKEIKVGSLEQVSSSDSLLEYSSKQEAYHQSRQSQN